MLTGTANKSASTDDTTVPYTKAPAPNCSCTGSQFVLVRKDQPNLATLSVEFWAMETMMMTTSAAMPSANKRVAYLKIPSPIRDALKPRLRAPIDMVPGPPAGSNVLGGVIDDAI